MKKIKIIAVCLFFLFFFEVYALINLSASYKYEVSLTRTHIEVSTGLSIVEKEKEIKKIDARANEIVESKGLHKKIMITAGALFLVSLGVIFGWKK